MNNLRIKSLFLAIPFIFGFAVFYIIPYGSVFYYAFSDITFSVGFAGFDNFIKVWENEYFRLATINTAVFTFISIPLLIFFSYLLANILYKYKSRIYRALLFVPVLVPSASIASLWKNLFNSDAVWPIYLLFIWKNIGLICLVITAGLVKIPVEIYDAAAIDGANTFQKHKSIILPLLSPVLYFCFLIGLIQNFKIFREIYLMYAAYPPENKYMIQHFIFNQFNKLDYAELSSGTLIFTLAIVLLLAASLNLGYVLFYGNGGIKKRSRNREK